MAELHCKNCKHWDGDAPLVPRGWGECALTESEDGLPTHDTIAFARGGELGSVLITRPEFGCSQWTEKVNADG
jgi:hypothetical protein